MKLKLVVATPSSQKVEATPRRALSIYTPMAAYPLFGDVASPLLFACAACYGKSDSPLASGMNAGIFTLMGVILSVLTCFALFFVHVMRGNGKTLDADSTPPAPNPTPKNPTDV